jgi:hypothetical protein
LSMAKGGRELRGALDGPPGGASGPWPSGATSTPWTSTSRISRSYWSRASRAATPAYRETYEMLGLSAVAHRDGTLVLEWAAGARTLGPDQPPPEGPLPDPTRYLPESSDSQRYRQARLRWGRQGSARAISFPASGRLGRP